MRRRRLSTYDPRKWLPRRKLLGELVDVENSLMDAENRAGRSERMQRGLEEAHQKLAFCYSLQAVTPPPAFVPSPPRTSFSRKKGMSDVEKGELARLLRIQAYYAAADHTAQAEPVGRALR